MYMKIINYIKEKNEKDFCYAACRCLPPQKAIELVRPNYSTYIHFNCPNCGEKLGLITKGRMDNAKGFSIFDF